MTVTTFHGDDVIPASEKDALFHVVPVPLEKTVSYQTGTALGPQAILEASCQLELYDNISIPADFGIFTNPPIDCRPAMENVLQKLQKLTSITAGLRKIPVILGGEHTLTLGCIRGLKEHYPSFGVIQFDAHADLRASYSGSELSHATVMRRVCDEKVPVIQIGTRSYSHEEHLFRKEKAIQFYDAEYIYYNSSKCIQIPDEFPDKIYITFDVDCFDSSLMPATGTPVPGGLNWFQVADILKNILSQKICLGFDIVELAPLKNFHGASFTAAQLTYNIMGYLTRSAVNKKYYRL